MGKQFKGFILGVIITVLCINPVTVLAKSLTQNISVTFDAIKIVIDGKQIDPKDASGNKVEPFIYNGITYLPIRAVGEALGKKVSWDSITKTAYLGTDESKPTSLEAYGRNNPAPINTPQSVTVDNYLEKYTATVVIKEIIEGEKAWEKIEKANMFNSKPETGKKYILAKIQVIVSNIKDDKAIDINGMLFKAFSSDNVEYPYALIVSPDPILNGQVYSGGSIEGYAAFLVNDIDNNPKCVFGNNYDGTGGMWFSLK